MWWLEATSRPVSPDLQERIADVVRDKVVVGFELSESLKSVLGASARALIDVEIASLRFLDDLLLSISTDHPQIRAGVERASLNDRSLAWQVEALRQRAGPVRDAISDFPVDCVLVAPQMGVDRAVMAQERFARIADHLDELSALTASHALSMVTAHPYARDDTSLLRELTALPGLRITGASSYRLLASGRISKVLAISSSLLAEATAFGVEAVRLDGRTPDKPRMVGLEGFAGPVADALAAVLGVELDVVPGSIVPSGLKLGAVADLNWAAGVEAQGMALPFVPTSLALSERLAPTDPRLREGLAYGWYAPEEWGVWSWGLGVINVGWPPGREEPLRCVMALRSFGPPGSEAAEQVWVEGRQVVRAATPVGELVEIEFLLHPPQRPGPIQLWLISETPWRPCEHLPGSRDDRCLGSGLVAMTLH